MMTARWSRPRASARFRQSFSTPWLARLERRFRNARPGSVMLMVVGVLVLLALMGTAMVATAGSDRASSSQNTANTQVGLLLDGVQGMVRDRIGFDLVGAESTSDSTVAQFRPHSDSTIQFGYLHADIINSTDADYAAPDAFIASRLPSKPTSAVQWQAISAPMIPGIAFRSPMNGVYYTQRGHVEPTYLTIDGRNFPAFRVTTTAGASAVVLAADTDGDGIADAGLWPLPMSQLNGITYYAAVRIIDNNSALNPAVAWEWNTAGANPFPDNVSLAAVTGAGADADADIKRLNAYRFGASAPSLHPGARGINFTFSSPYEAVWAELGSRLGNTDRNFGLGRYQSLAGGGSISIPSHFVIKSGGKSVSTVENLLSATLSRAPSAPYPADAIDRWYAENFSDNSFNPRALLTPSNAVSNHISAHSTSGAGSLGVPHGAMAPYNGAPAVKTSINTADFPELARSFWNVMCDTPMLPPFGALDEASALELNNFVTADTQHPQRMFRSVLRDIRYSTLAPAPGLVHFDASNMLFLRAFAAAANTEALRSSSKDTVGHTVVLAANGDFDGAIEDTSSGLDHSRMREFDGRIYRNVDAVRRRPIAVANDGQTCTVENWWIHDVTDQKGVYISCADTTTRLPNGTYPTFGKLILQNIDVGPVTLATHGYHIDSFKLEGGRDSVKAPDLLMQDIYIHDNNSGVMTDLMNWSWGDVVLRRVKAQNVFNSIILGGPMRTCLIDDCPGLRVDIMGDPGTTGTVIVRNSPGAVVKNVNNINGVNPGAKIIFENGAPSDPGPAAPTTRPVSERVETRVYGYRPQPFITEVYASSDNESVYPDSPDRNPKGYVAIELYNPYNFDIPLNNWRIGLIDKRTKEDGGSPEQYYRRRIVPLLDSPPFPASAVIKANSRLVLENFTASPSADGLDVNAAKVRPPQAAKTLGAVAVNPATLYVRNLHQVMRDTSDTASTGGEMVLLRPHRFDGTLEAFNDPADPSNSYDETIGDSPTAVAGQARSNLAELVPVDQFDFTGMVIPPTLPDGALPNPDAQMAQYHYVRANDSNNAWKFVYPGRYNGRAHVARQEGSDPKFYAYSAGPGALKVAVNLGAADARSSYVNNFPGIPLATVGMPSGVGSDPRQFPYGGFATVGELLHTTYFSAYRVRELGASGLRNDPDVCLELHSVTMDASFADDTDPNNDEYEQVGRFCPLPADFASDRSQQHYLWTTDLFDYFTVLAPHDDYIPNANPRSTAFNVAPIPVSNKDGFIANGPDERGVGVEGLVNLNTASWRVISALPMIPSDPDANAALARAIADFRDGDGTAASKGHGPFKSIYELNLVPGFQTAMGTIDLGDGADYQANFAALNRISNLVTLRSDVFTCYVMVQGWRNANSAHPVLVVQRRVASLMDRNAVKSAEVRSPSMMNLPQD